MSVKEKICGTCKSVTHSANCPIYLAQQATAKGLQFNNYSGKLATLGDKYAPTLLVIGVKAKIPAYIEQAREVLGFKSSRPSDLVKGIQRRYNLAA